MNIDYSKDDVKKALFLLGVRRGDVVFSHMNIGPCGIPDCKPSMKSVYELWKGAFLETLGDDGIWVLPSFSYSFCHNEVFDPFRTKSQCGILSEAMCDDRESSRSEDANFSVVAVGRRAKELVSDMPERSFGEDGVFDRLLKMDAVFVNINVHPATTFIHYVEASLDVPYRWHKAFPGIMKLAHGEERRSYHHFVYDLDISDHAPDFSRFNDCALNSGKAVSATIGRGMAVKITAADTYSIVKEKLTEDISFLLRGRFHG